ncbi:MAG TPA: PIG-L family deacetylase [Anaerolineae bacterium]|nr:PIG-L family deacetylase [Anaerolineae bacterium]
MKLHREGAEIWVPDGVPEGLALARTTHLAVGAHQDDLEIMAVDGILRCFGRGDRWFCGVVVTDGAGSPRDGLYRDTTDEQMRAVRREEQKKAAVVGEYGALVLLDYPSAAVKGGDEAPVDDLVSVLRAAGPGAVYTHNPADRHDTHVAVALRTIEALRRLPPAGRPGRVYGVEVWRDLDWLVDDDRVVLDVSAHENLQAALLGVFDSQIAGGKRYDLATLGRRRANATYLASHDVDAGSGVTLALDLTPLIEDPALDVAAYVLAAVDRLARDVADRLQRLARPAVDAER